MADVTQLTPHIARVELMNATRTNIYLVRGSDGDTLDRSRPRRHRAAFARARSPR